MVSGIGAPVIAGQSESERVRSAAAQFESLLINEVLKMARESDGGWLGGGEDGSSTALGEYGEQAFAQMLSQQGGLGLQSLIARGLAKSAPESVQAEREAK